MPRAPHRLRSTARRARAGAIGVVPIAAAAALVGITLIVVAFPATLVLADIVRGLAADAAAPSASIPTAARSSTVAIARSLTVAGVIALLATALAWPVAWSLRGRRASAVAWLVAPLLLPSYLAYVGWGLLRAPGTWLGDLILRGPPGTTAGENWLPPLASLVQAIVGLALWAWPLAALVLILGLRRIDAPTLDAIRLDAPSALRRHATVLRLVRGPLLAALGATFIVMLGSAVPLHVAQLDTLAITLWKRLDQTPRAEHWRLWLDAWPLLAAAAVGAATLVRGLSSLSADTLEIARTPGRAARAPLLILLALSVGLPIALFATTAPSPAQAWASIRLSAPPLAGSAAIATATGILTAGIALLAWAADRGHARLAPLAALAALGLTMLLPGVLVGSATLRAWNWLALHVPPAAIVVDTSAIVVLAHVARFGALGLVAGLVLARTHPRDLTDLERLDAAAPARAWLRATVAPAMPQLLALALAAACLSLHEIEAAVIVEPPSAAGGSFARSMLQQLHFNRGPELATGVMLVAALALTLALAASWLARRRAT